MFKVTPESSYTDYYDIARFNLTWKINLFLTIVLPILGIVMVSFDQTALYPTLIAFGMTLSLLILLYRTKTYKIAAFVFCSIGSFLCVFTMCYFSQANHLAEPLWITVVILYAFFTLQGRWGIVFSAVNFIGLGYYILFVLNEGIHQNFQLTQGERIQLAANCSIAAVVIIYLTYQFLKTNEYARKSQIKLNAELQRKNKEVEHQNEEKTVMLREIHHRVKNNLQVITSLLRLQSREIKDEAIISHFDDAIQRVLSMASIHEKMYQSDDLVRIDLKAYLIELAGDLITSYSYDKPIDLKVETELNYLQPKSLVSTALLFNELISNSLKHGFRDKSSGEIRININLSDNNSKIECEYYDNGSWKAPVKEGSFGVQLISDLVDQLDGTFSRDISNGTTYKFTFDYERLD